MSDAQYLHLAAKLALRGHGGAEPNPMVGCVIVDDAGAIVGWGYHRRIGGPHAERVALDRAGAKARGATLFVTLEPCNHVGRTPPCSEACIKAGIKRVVFARRDPNPVSTGGEARLREAGIDVVHATRASFAAHVAAPFVRCVTTPFPWVIAKWAQTIDGKLALPAHENRWLSSERSRRMVHRERGRVDAILTGIGTVKADDPLLTVRHSRQRRTPRRIVIDPRLETPERCRMLSTIHEAPVTIVGGLDAPQDRAHALMALGATVLQFPVRDGRFQLADVLDDISLHCELSTIITECGPGLLRALFDEGLVNMMWVFVAPREVGDDFLLPTMFEPDPDRLAAQHNMQLLDVRARGGDDVRLYGNMPDNP